VCAYDAQKNALKPWQQKPWVIPPQADAEFVCAMEDVLEVSTRLYNPHRPQVCADETRKQLVAETRAPIPATPSRHASIMRMSGKAPRICLGSSSRWRNNGG
jgi:hypothetical protein